MIKLGKMFVFHLDNLKLPLDNHSVILMELNGEEEQKIDSVVIADMTLSS